MKQRIEAYDLARAFAIFGMVIVNFNIAMTTGASDDSPLGYLIGLLEGRASALFVVLAGVGISFLTGRAMRSGLKSDLTRARNALVKRGLLLIVIGLTFVPIWEADILHFYGFYFLIAACIFTFGDRRLLTLAIAAAALFPVLMLIFDYERNWEWTTLAYERFWTLDGMVRHLFFNGFHPVFPWVAFLIFGIWLGRQDLSRNTLRVKLLLSSVITLAITEVSFYILRAVLEGDTSLGMSSEELDFLLAISVIPPMPQYVLSATCSSIIAIIACLYVSDRFGPTRPIVGLIQAGKMSLTLYFAHIIVGMGLLEAIGRLGNQSTPFSLLSAVFFCIVSVGFSVLWLKRFSIGPLEWIFRKVAA